MLAYVADVAVVAVAVAAVLLCNIQSHHGIPLSNSICHVSYLGHFQHCFSV